MTKEPEFTYIPKTTNTFLSFDGTPIYYEIRGKGEPLVLIYGIGCLMNHWHYQVEYFSRNYQVILFDIRGHHKSTPVQNFNNLKLEHLAKDLNALLKHLHLKKANIVGHSFGGPYIIKAYEMFPEIFSSIVLINGFARNPLKQVMGFDFNVVEPFFYFLKNQYNKFPDLWSNLWRGLIDNPVAFQLAALAGGFNIRLTQFKDIEVYGRGVARLDLPVFFAMFEEIFQYDGSAVLPTIKCPTLIVAGEHDAITPTTYQKEMHAAINHSELLMVPYGSHCSQLDFPEFINLKLESFLNKDLVHD